MWDLLTSNVPQLFLCLKPDLGTPLNVPSSRGVFPTQAVYLKAVDAGICARTRLKVAALVVAFVPAAVTRARDVYSAGEERHKYVL